MILEGLFRGFNQTPRTPLAKGLRCAVTEFPKAAAHQDGYRTQKHNGGMQNYVILHHMYNPVWVTSAALLTCSHQRSSLCGWL